MSGRKSLKPPGPGVGWDALGADRKIIAFALIEVKRECASLGQKNATPGAVLSAVRELCKLKLRQFRIFSCLDQSFSQRAHVGIVPPLSSAQPLARKRKCAYIVAMNWTSIIQDLMASGLSQSEIAAKCQTGQSHISGLFRGERKQPGWQLGQSLIALHAERTKSEQAA